MRERVHPTPERPQPDGFTVAAAEVRVVYVDASLVVLDKPSGLLSVPGRGADKQDCLAGRVQRQYPDALVVHRLDMDTSGLIVMARGAAMQRALSMAFAARGVLKRYVAVVAGRLEPSPDEWGLVDLPLRCDWPARPRQMVDPVQGKPSQTRWRVLAHGDGVTRVELEPLTGRSHQLRVHLRELGHPILGDPLYASDEQCARAPRLLLHACTLQFPHPVSGEPVVFRSEVPF